MYLACGVRRRKCEDIGKGGWSLEGLELDEKNQWVLWQTEAEQLKKGELAWRMLENNQILGFLPFDYYYIDNQICFRYAYHSLQRVETFFHRKMGDFETLCFLCEETLKILERGQEYLLDESGYLLLPEWIFWNRCEKKVFLCYLPGKDGEAAKEYTMLLEYLMQHTDHSDKNAVSLIYGLYELLDKDGFILENLLSYLQKAKSENVLPAYSKQMHGEGQGSERNISTKYLLKPLPDSRNGKLWRKLFCGQEGAGCFIRQEKLAVGREKESDLFLPFGTVSRRHALFFSEPDGFYLMDTISTTGTYLNGNKISAYVKTPCKENDIITFADISYQLVKVDGD